MVGSALLIALAGCQPKPAAVVRQGSGTPKAGATGATANLAPGDPPGEWRRQARDFANTRFSQLDQVNTGTVARLKLAWSFADGIPCGHEAAPLVVGDTLYVVTPFPNIAYALDLGKPGAPIKWTYQPHPQPISIGKACCDAVNRGPTFADGKLVVFSLLDGEAVAVDAATGKPVWRTTLGDPTRGMTITMSPLVVGNSVLVGNSGGEMGVRGQLTALDLATGKEQWRAYSTGPDADVKIGAGFHAPYAWLNGKDLGVSTWPADAWKRGGGTVWGWISYDPDLDLIYYGTSNPSPRVPAQRPGDNLWSAAVFARSPPTSTPSDKPLTPPRTLVQAARDWALAWIAGLVIAAAMAAGVMQTGAYDVSATTPHNPIVAWVLHNTMIHSVEARADGPATDQVFRGADPARTGALSGVLRRVPWRARRLSRGVDDRPDADAALPARRRPVVEPWRSRTHRLRRGEDERHAGVADKPFECGRQGFGGGAGGPAQRDPAILL